MGRSRAGAGAPPLAHLPAHHDGDCGAGHVTRLVSSAANRRMVGVWRWLSGALRAYAVALPGQEPALPPMVELWSHHLHCVAHSAIIAVAVTLLAWALRRSLWIPLLGWWSHIVIDVFTHSADYYPSPVLYPITERGFDGLAWNTPWFIVLNYAALGLTGLWLWRFKRSRCSQ